MVEGGLGACRGVGAKEEEEMDKWYVFVVVGLVVGMNLGYMVGIRRGSAIVGELISGILEGFGGIVGAVTDERSKE